MKVEDFMDMFTQLVIVRDFPANNFGVEYNPAWKVQKGFASTIKKNIQQDTRQFIFTQESAQPVQVTALLTQLDPRLNQDVAAPYKEHRSAIGLIAMSMGKGKIRPNEKIVKFEPNR